VRRPAKIAIAAGVAATTWVAGLFIAGFAARGCVAERMEDRLAASLDARVHIDAIDVGLVRGAFAMSGLAIDRQNDGNLHVGVERIDAGIAPLGAYLWDRDLDQVRVRGVDVEVDGWGVLRLQTPRRPPVRVAGLVVDDARLSLSPVSWAPRWARVSLTIDHAEAGDTVLRTPMSWVFSLEQLDAHLDVPGASPVMLHFAAGRLTASGSLLGAAPVTIAVTVPAPDPGHEGEQLRALGKDIAERLALARASDWIMDAMQR
jgi:hypothetical protein